jgi:L-fuculose-phosphate aldolase
VDDLVTVDAEGAKLDGPGKPTMKVKSHLNFYEQRQDVNAVIHCHPSALLAWAMAGKLPLLKAYCEGYFLVGQVELI